ncbi:MAG: HAD-IA family hydrolase [Planctomycetes bacterium]|nr:HAD-IA family hydrolase [Planctomycetota bacterium]
MAKLDAVFFDIDDTLFPTTEFARSARQNAVRAMIEAGLDLPEALVWAELEEVIAEFSSNYEHHFDHLLKRLRRPHLERLNKALVVAAGVAAYHDTKFREIAPFPDVPELLRDLKRSGVIVGIITHGLTVKQAEKLLRLRLLPHLTQEAIFISEQVGISKPNPKLYSTALATLTLAPSRVMYVGDNPIHDVAPPQSVGMVTCWSSRAARRSLKETGVAADHEVADFGELRTILRERYALDV